MVKQGANAWVPRSLALLDGCPVPCRKLPAELRSLEQLTELRLGAAPVGGPCITTHRDVVQLPNGRRAILRGQEYEHAPAAAPLRAPASEVRALLAALPRRRSLELGGVARSAGYPQAAAAFPHTRLAVDGQRVAPAPAGR